ncbi:MAG: hypothetical protein AB7E77_09440 [Desulfobulbus sp.]
MARTCPFLPLLILCLPFCLFGCGQSSGHHPLPGSRPSATVPEKGQTGASQVPRPLPQAGAETSSCIDPIVVQNSKRNRAACYHLQPARTVSTTQTVHHGGKRKQARVATKKSNKKNAKTKSTRPRKTVSRTVGLCQPQSLIYARCRTGITTCRLGNTSPVQWFACARKRGATSNIPVAGSVMVIDVHPERRIHTGHPAYVEEARRNEDGTWRLRISHTNYDRKCHLDQDATVLFFPRTMTASFATGPWSPWAKHLKVLGFILR